MTAGMRGFLTAVVLVLLTPAGLAGEPAAESAEGWLSRLGPAMNMTTYRGVFVYARGDQVNSMRVAHRYRNGQVEERLVQQDGENGEILRKGMRVYCVLPDHGSIQLDQVIPSGPFAEAFANQLMPVSDYYTPELLADDRVAGYDTVVVVLRARDQHRYSYRLWLEKETGLLVKSHVHTPDEEVLERFQFTSLEITDSLPDEEFELTMEGSEARHQLVSDRSAEQSPVPSLRMDGWSLGWQPEGFVPAASPRAGRGQAVAFSDGLAAFSVFVEPRGDLQMPTGASRIGATTAYLREVNVGKGVFRVTVVGEIPPATAMKVAQGVDVGDALAMESTP